MNKTRTNKDGSPDKRYGAHDKPYCGTKAPEGSETASFNMKARDGFSNDENYQKFKKFYEYKEKHFHEELTSQKKLTDWAVEHCCKLQRGNFCTAFAEESDKPYLSHETKCNNAWYFHNDAALIQRSSKGIREKRRLADICEKHGWNGSHSKKINEEAHEELGRWFSHEYIKNICASKTKPDFPEDMGYELDYGTQSKYTIESSDWEQDGKPTHVKMTLKIGDENQRESLEFAYDIPERILLQPYTLLSMRKPCFYKGDDGELMVTIPYWYMPPKLPLGNGALGADAGIIRIMKCGMVYKDGRFIENIAMSAEVEKKNAHIRLLMKEKERLYDKKERIRRLIEHNSNPQDVVCLEKKFERLEKQYSDVRSNIASERESLCWLVARDLSVLVRQYGGDRIRIEDLSWVGGSGQSWNFSQIRKSIDIVLKRYGVKLEEVNANKSSKQDPSSEGLALAKEASEDSRICVWSDGTKHDRDDTAGLELGCREPKRIKHDRDARVPGEISGDKREYAPEIVAVKPRGRAGKRKSKTRRESGRPKEVDYSYRPDLESFYSSIRKRKQELASTRKGGGENFSWFDFVVGASRSVALLRECRSVDFVPSGSKLGGVPAHPTGAIQSSTGKAVNTIVEKR